jgi:hypothetical protein
MTRWPMTVMWLRCKNLYSQADREFQPWCEMVVNLITRGETACVRPNWERTQRQMWLDLGDPE